MTPEEPDDPAHAHGSGMDAAPSTGREATETGSSRGRLGSTGAALALASLLVLTGAANWPEPVRPPAVPQAEAVPGALLPPPVRAWWVWRVDVNAAGAHEFATLPGIGPAMADRLVRTRDDLGGFVDAASLTQTPGIGDRTLQRIRPWIRVAPEG